MDKLIKDRGVINYKIKFDKQSKSRVNYNLISEALNIEGLSTNDTPSKPEAIEEFIKMIRNVSISDSKPGTMNRKNIVSKEKVEMNKNESLETDDHNVKNFTRLYHPVKIERDEDKPLSDRLRILLQLCRKLPFERSPNEIDKIHKILRTFPILFSQVDDDLLRLLSNVIIYEHLDTAELTLFGNKGFYILLSGRVRPVSSPFIRLIGEPAHRFISTNKDTEDDIILNPGDCFGTLDEITIENTDCSRLLMSRAVSSCEVLLITTSYYRRILEKYETQKHADKLILLKSQETFSVWPHQALVRIANILSWSTIPANTLICKEDDISTVLGFIQDGSCYVLRKLDVKKTLPNGKTITQSKQVLIGTITKGQSFGEVSLLDQSPMRHSLLTKEDMKVIQTSKDKIASLDSDVRLLLRQSCIAAFDNVTKTTVENTYMEQKMKKDWVTLKESVISEVIESRGIRPGHGKWNIMANPGDIY